MFTVSGAYREKMDRQTSPLPAGFTQPPTCSIAFIPMPNEQIWSF